MRIWPAWLALATLALIWGYNWVVMKQVLQYADPFDFAALRTLFGALALFCLLLLRRDGPWLPAAWGAVVALGLLQGAGFSALIQWALVDGGAGKTSVLVYVMPFWLLPLAWLWLGERISGLQWPAVGLAAVGLFLLLEPWYLQAAGLQSQMLALLAGVCWAVSAVIVKRLRRKGAIDLLSLSAWQLLIGSLVLCLIAWWLPSRPIEPTGYFFAALAYNALPATALAWVLWLFVLGRVTAGVAGLSSLAVPAVGVMAAWLELGERPNVPEGAGMVLIAFALALLTWAASRGVGEAR